MTLKAEAINHLSNALNAMKEAESNIQLALQISEVKHNFGYSLGIIQQELNRFSDNSEEYLSGNTSIAEMIESIENNDTN